MDSLYRKTSKPAHTFAGSIANFFRMSEGKVGKIFLQGYMAGTATQMSEAVERPRSPLRRVITDRNYDSDPPRLRLNRRYNKTLETMAAKLDRDADTAKTSADAQPMHALACIMKTEQNIVCELTFQDLSAGNRPTLALLWCFRRD
jgi:hypothetical protein